MSESLPYALLRPVRCDKPSPGPEHVVRWDDVDWGLLAAAITSSELWAYDYETRGTETWKPATKAVGLALAWLTRDGTIDYVYIDDSEGDGSILAGFVDFLWINRAPYSAICSYNAYFDSAITRMHRRRDGIDETDAGLRITNDCYLLHRLLASEGWPGQSWSLKYAMVQLLGWSDTNEKGIEDWLVGHGFHTSGPDLEEGETPEAHLRRCEEWVAVNPTNRRCTPDKSQMHRVPPNILGPYACLDAVATVQLMMHVLQPVLTHHPLVVDWEREYLLLVSLLIDQQYYGIRLDRAGLEARGAECARLAGEREAEAARHGALAPVLSKWRDYRLAPLYEREPPQYKKFNLGDEPRHTTAKGEVSKSWLQWCVKRDKGPEPTKTWPEWRARMDLAERTPQFHFSSNDHMRWLLFGSSNSKFADGPEWAGLLGWEWGEDPDPKKGRKGTVWVTGRHGKVEVDRTPGGLLPVDDVVLSQLCDGVREPILSAAEARKELQFVDAYVSLAWFHPSAAGTQTENRIPGEWRIHPGWTIHGTKTGRLAGKDPSLHQIVKTVEFLRHLTADAGCVWVEMDFAALEPHVLAELSRDPGLMELYGPGAPPHDRYLFSLSKYPGPLGNKVRSLYPTDWSDLEAAKAAIAETKSKCKTEREAGKEIVLSSDYGAGWRKQLRRLNARGIRMTANEVRALNEGHRELHRGVYTDYAGRLEKEWERRGGWVMSALGTPTPVWGERLKDLVNRCIAEGTWVRVRNKGWIQIENVVAGYEVWDGESWVMTSGLLSNGTKSCISVGGVWMTPDHNVMTEGGWRAAEYISRISALQEGTRPHANWKDVWGLVCLCYHTLAQELGLIYRSRMSARNPPSESR